MLRRNYQNNKKATFMVQTRSQSKGVKASTVQKASNPSNRGEQEIKPIIIDDAQTTPNLLSVNNQQNCIQARKPTNLKTPEINQPYPQLVMRLLLRSPDLLGTETLKINAGIGPNLDFEETHLIKRK